MGGLRLNVLAVEVRQPHDADEQEACYVLRWEVLRAPWQQPRGSECDEREDSARHYMVVDAEAGVLATGRIHSIDTGTAQIRYMAVRPGCERRGLGKRLLVALEADAAARGETRIILHARENSLGFYRHCGYRIIRESHQLFGSVQHYEMGKHLHEETG